jgi:hypothetical protein
MGSITQMLKNISGANEDEQAQRERLEMMLSLARARIQVYRDEISEMFTNPAMIDQKQIPGIRAIRYIEQYHVASKQNVDQQVKDHMNAAIQSFFSIGGNEDTKKAIQNGLQSLISGALDGFIGSTEIGESEQRVYVVVPENNAFIRADIACWKYHFEQHKIIDQSDSAVAYVLCKSVIDHTKLTIDELIYLVTEAMLNRKELAFPVPEATKMAAADALNADLAKLTAKPKLVARETTKRTFTADELNKLPDVKTDGIKSSTDAGYTFSKETVNPTDGNAEVAIWTPKLRLPSTLDTSIAPTAGTPPGITQVEAYIDELVRVWRKLKEDRQ